MREYSAIIEEFLKREGLGSSARVKLVVRKNEINAKIEKKTAPRPTPSEPTATATKKRPATAISKKSPVIDDETMAMFRTLNSVKNYDIPAIKDLFAQNYEIMSEHVTSSALLQSKEPLQSNITTEVIVAKRQRNQIKKSEQVQQETVKLIKVKIEPGTEQPVVLVKNDDDNEDEVRPSKRARTNTGTKRSTKKDELYPKDRFYSKLHHISTPKVTTTASDDLKFPVNIHVPDLFQKFETIQNLKNVHPYMVCALCDNVSAFMCKPSNSFTHSNHVCKGTPCICEGVKIETKRHCKDNVCKFCVAEGNLTGMSRTCNHFVCETCYGELEERDHNAHVKCEGKAVKTRCPLCVEPHFTLWESDYNPYVQSLSVFCSLRAPSSSLATTDEYIPIPYYRPATESPDFALRVRATMKKVKLPATLQIVVRTNEQQTDMTVSEDQLPEEEPVDLENLRATYEEDLKGAQEMLKKVLSELRDIYPSFRKHMDALDMTVPKKSQILTVWKLYARVTELRDEIPDSLLYMDNCKAHLDEHCKDEEERALLVVDEDGDVSMEDPLLETTTTTTDERLKVIADLEKSINEAKERRIALTNKFISEQHTETSSVTECTIDELMLPANTQDMHTLHAVCRYMMMNVQGFVQNDELCTPLFKSHLAFKPIVDEVEMEMLKSSGVELEDAMDMSNVLDNDTDSEDQDDDMENTN